MIASPKSRNVTRGARGALVVAALVGTSAAPALALPSAYRDAVGHPNAERSSFHRHFYRGQQGHGAHYGSGFRMGAAPLADPDDFVDDTAYGGDALPIDDAVGSCADRFRSYDPASGTYLGYDGERHPCP